MDFQGQRPVWRSDSGIIRLLPLQNHFNVDVLDHLEPLVSPPPMKPTKKLLDYESFSKFLAGTSSALLEIEWNERLGHWERGPQKLIYLQYDFCAGLRLNAQGNHYLIGHAVTGDGTKVADQHVIFAEDFATEANRGTHGYVSYRCYKTNVYYALKVYERKMAKWFRERTEWEINLAYLVWDEGLGIFPPFTTSRDQLGDKHLDIIPAQHADFPPEKEIICCLLCPDRPVRLCRDCDSRNIQAHMEKEIQLDQELIAFNGRILEEEMEICRQIRNTHAGRDANDDGPDDNWQFEEDLRRAAAEVDPNPYYASGEIIVATDEQRRTFFERVKREG